MFSSSPSVQSTGAVSVHSCHPWQPSALAHESNTRKIFLCNSSLKTGTFTMWAEHIVLLTRGSFSYSLASFYMSLSNWHSDSIRGLRSNTGAHCREIFLCLCLFTTHQVCVRVYDEGDLPDSICESLLCTSFYFYPELCWSCEGKLISFILNKGFPGNKLDNQKACGLSLVGQ